MDQKKVLVAMSGGVDSSVTAALLLQKGYEVRGVYLIPWHASEIGFSEAGNPEETQVSAQQAADRLGIQLDVLTLKNEFYSRVVDYFIDGYRMGKTPNPCYVCNRVFKWTEFLQHADRIGYQFVASGHYARLENTEDGSAHLYQAADLSKDQSYVLSCLDQTTLQRILLPLGNLKKSEVRRIAAEKGFLSADRSDSQDMCFLLNTEHKAFIQKMLGKESGIPGDIINPEGEVIGQHSGLENYTIGQRKGIKISAPDPYYVLHKNIKENQLLVGPRRQTKANGLIAADAHWLQRTPPAERFEAGVKIRYHSKVYSARIIVMDDRRMRILFSEFVQGITPGQFAVIYRDNEVLGAGEIEKEIEIEA